MDALLEPRWNMGLESVSGQAAHNHGHETQMAERPKEGELWREMIERQRKEGTDRDGSSRELLRSLPLEQKQERNQERSNVHFDQPLMGDNQQSYHEMLRDAARSASQEQERGIDR
jgi:hypothetical protein